MSFVDMATDQPISAPFEGVPDQTADQSAIAEADRPDLAQTAGAAFRHGNNIVSFFSRQDAGIPQEVDPAFNTFAQIKGTPMESRWPDFVDIHNAKAFEMRRSQIAMEDQDNRDIAASGPVGYFMQLAAGGLDPAFWMVPGLAEERAASVGAGALKGALNFGAASAVQEAGLQLSQQTRPLSESGFNVGASMLLGGFVGGVAAHFSPEEQQAAESAVEKMRTTGIVTRPPDQPMGFSLGSDAGAASIENFSRDDLTVSGTAARTVAEATSALNPNLRLNVSPSSQARLLGQKLAENTVFQNAFDEGKTPGAAAETLIRQTSNARLADAIEAHDQIFSDARKAGLKMTAGDFEDAVGRAMRRGDVGENDAVTAAAQSWRSKLFDPFKDEAISEKLLPEDVGVDTADSYFRRLYDQRHLTAGEHDFKSIVRDWAQNEGDRLTKRFDDETEDLVAKAGDDAASVRAERNSLRNEKFNDGGPQYTQDIANAVYDKLTGRGLDNNFPDNIVPTARGPLKERTFSIPDQLIEKYLHDNVKNVGREYSRKMASQIELTRRFGSVDLKEPLAKVTDEYRGLREQVSAAAEPDAIKTIVGKGFGKDLEKAKKAALEFLEAREKRDNTDIAGIRDLLTGSYKLSNFDKVIRRPARGLAQFNFIRLMGNQLMGSMTDIARPAMVYGLSDYMKDGIAPLLSAAGRAAVGLSKKEARLAGQVVERVLHHRLASMAEIGDPYADATAIERMLDWGTNVGSRWSGILLWTDAMKTVSSVMAQNRILRLVRDGSDQRTLAYLGIDNAMRGRILDEVAAHAEDVQGVGIANTEKWTDAQAVRAYRAAMNKDVDSVITTRSVGDVPLMANTPLGKLILQFKTFNLASHQRVMLRGLQDGNARLASGLVAMTSIGMLQTWLSLYYTNRQEDFAPAMKNPGWWLAEGIDRSGVMAVPMELANIGEKLSGVNVLKSPIKRIGAEVFGAPADGQSLRYDSRGKVSSLLGPTPGFIEDAAAALGTPVSVAQGQNASKSQINAAFRMLPFYSYPGMRYLLENYAKPAVMQHYGH